MAGYSFAPSQVGGFGGGILSTGEGAAMGNAANAGLRLANGFREYQNSNMLDQYQIPAAEAGYHASELQGAQAANTAQDNVTAQMQERNTPFSPNVAPVGAAPFSANVAPVGATPQGLTTLQDPALMNYQPQNLQYALTGDVSQRNALNYQPDQTLTNSAPMGAPGTAYIRY